MKKLIRLVAGIVCAALFASLAGCGGGSLPREKTLKITVSNLGFGTEWLYAIAAEFEDLYGADVKIEKTVVTKELLTQLESGYQLDDLCLFAGVDAAWDTMRLGKFMPLDDVWNATVDGEDKPVRDKVVRVYKDAYLYNGHYYSMPFITEAGGLGYNKTTLDTLFGAGNWTLPKTTGELDALCAAIKAAGAYAFTWSNKENSCYWALLDETWTAQYDTAEAYTMANFAKVYDKTAGGYVLDETGELLGRPGRLRSYQTAYPYINMNRGYSHQYSTSMIFAESQAAFAGVPYANDDKIVAFTPTGSWLYEESKEDIEYKLQEVGIIKPPVVSAIVEKLSFYDETVDYALLSSDKKNVYDAALRAILDYADGEAEQPPATAAGRPVTAADVEAVRAARGVLYMKDQSHAFIPVNSKNPDLAKQFLTFFCSDYAGEIYSTVTHGFSPFYVKATEGNSGFLNRFDREVCDMINGSPNIVLPDSRTGFYYSRPGVENHFFTSSGQYATPEKLYNDYYVAVNRKNWKDLLRTAGLQTL